jgi:hypothetical protein
MISSTMLSSCGEWIEAPLNPTLVGVSTSLLVDYD